MQCRHVPNHIAIIQDGNRRYAKMLGIDTPKGHRAGADKTEEMLDWAHELGIRHITLYTFSTENFSRKKDEVEDLSPCLKKSSFLYSTMNG
jgi:tritrans,polycis-undecaprenyl-diphosphate synthase [geranylgeranyl-diphosphate specific]